MQDTAGKSNFLRLKRVLLNDKTLPGGLLSVLTSDIHTALSGYFDYEESELKIDLDLEAGGRYVLKIEAPIERVKNVKII